MLFVDNPMIRQFLSLVVYLWATCFLLADKDRDRFYGGFWEPKCYFKVVPDDQLVLYRHCLSFQRPIGISEKKQLSETIAKGIRGLCAEECLFALRLLVCSEMKEKGYRKSSFAEEEEGPLLEAVRREILVHSMYRVDKWNEAACLLAFQLVGEQWGIDVGKVSFAEVSCLTPETQNEVKLVVRQLGHMKEFLSAVRVRLSTLGVEVAMPLERQESVPLKLSGRVQDAVRNLVLTAVYMDDFRAELKRQIEFFGVNSAEMLKAVVHAYWFGDAWEEDYRSNYLEN